VHRVEEMLAMGLSRVAMKVRLPHRDRCYLQLDEARLAFFSAGKSEVDPRPARRPCRRRRVATSQSNCLRSINPFSKAPENVGYDVVLKLVDRHIVNYINILY